MAEPVRDLEPESARPRLPSSGPSVSPSQNLPHTSEGRKGGDEATREMEEQAAPPPATMNFRAASSDVIRRSTVIYLLFFD
jgi:hypothetical protein